jgi:hypothetical protein
MFYRIYLFKSIGRLSEGDYESAYKYIVKSSKFAREENIFCALVRSYLALLSSHEEDSYRCIELFYVFALDDKNKVRYTRNDDEWAWFLLFAEYILHAVSGKGVSQFSADKKLIVEEPDNIDFSNIQNLHKRIFSPKDMPGIKRGIEQYRSSTKQDTDSN